MDAGRDIERTGEDWLRASRPKPDPAFVQSLEERLFPGPRARRSFAPRPVFAGGLAAGALAVAALVLGLAGVGPVGSGDHTSRSESDCHFVTVHVRQRVPVVVDRGQGPKLTYQERTVERRVKRCP